MNKREQKTFCKEIKADVKKAGYSMGHFLKKAGISRSHWYFIKEGERPITPEKLLAISDFFSKINQPT